MTKNRSFDDYSIELPWEEILDAAERRGLDELQSRVREHLDHLTQYSI